MSDAEWLRSEDPAAMLAFICDRHPRSGRATRMMASERKLQLYGAALLRFGDRAAAPLALAVEVFADDHHWRWLLRQAWKWFLRDDGKAAPEVADEWAIGLTRDKVGPHCLAVANLLRDIVGNPFSPVRLPVAAGSADSCLWLTPDVLSLARAAYHERGTPCPGNAVGPCCQTKLCPVCLGRCRIDEGTLDHFRLALLADALEEAGCTGECVLCGGTKRTIDKERVMEIVNGLMTLDARAVAMEAIRAGIIGSKVCPCNQGRSEHPLLAHLRSDGPHVRGCWALDLILGKE